MHCDEGCGGQTRRGEGAAQILDADGTTERGARGCHSQTNNNGRTDHADLGRKPWITGLDLAIFGLFVKSQFSTPLPLEVLDRVRYIGLFTFEPGLNQRPVQHPTCRSYKRMPLSIFLVPRLFADEHHFCWCVALAENCLRCVSVEIAAFASP